MSEEPAVAFSTRLREATWSDHRAAEAPPVLTALVGGELDRAGYARLAAQHYFIYRALEECAGPMRDDPVAGGFVDERLTRLPSLVADLEFLVGADWDGRISPGAATRAYVARIREVCDAGPVGFVAHHYTRYLGDLSGGLFIGRGITRAYGLTDGRGVAFYRFEAIGDPRAYKAAYRRRLDDLRLSEPQRAALIEEVVVAYRHNTAVLAELGSELLDAVTTAAEGRAA
ncbi:biliverdin-producing heme oxygenase [Solwaraspora sp. WMMD1047]|uniref:biliverdin-producing heme oxygenase n=1 Tax=Solwaraspora sp. WMMD1047 TaxID=3016102 RepID=UPI002417A8D6|nr:biliverdin-producing heme oxygenase [Solwaraspora sp. WMMD1047]MDG4830882.1 biliverdin-producing heme oxygenase [Solwaraspora sp. WMMD1047]